jgi:hypothetical protein
MSKSKDNESGSGAPPEETPLIDDNPTAENSAGTDNGGQGNAGSETQNNNTPPPDKKKPGGEKQMGLVTFIQIAEPNKYVVSILKAKHGMEAHTKSEWEQIVKDLLNKKVS